MADKTKAQLKEELVHLQSDLDILKEDHEELVGQLGRAEEEAEHLAMMAAWKDEFVPALSEVSSKLRELTERMWMSHKRTNTDPFLRSFTGELYHAMNDLCTELESLEKEAK